ncbi:hypothetical protein Acr_12g0009350 [Actinidia rufa]|uniref:Uncharacterized protein n=1 Tax=Actinidia rufa TaxID=165716 RepID=A0A7J0FI71_9ERIC|nr:hypothetical protein Acr_12g0009350 [Actinidia rufa]
MPKLAFRLFGLPNVILQLGEHLDPGHEVPEPVGGSSVSNELTTFGALVFMTNRATNDSVSRQKFSIDPGEPSSVSRGSHGTEDLTSRRTSHPIVTSRSSLASGDNRPGFCFEVAFAALCASASSLPPLSPGVLGTCGGSPSSTTAGTIFSLRSHEQHPSSGSLDYRVVHPLFISAEELVILPAIMDFLARIWAEHRARVVQASLCPVSSSGFPPISVCQLSCGVTVGSAVE